jgi:uncharacterized protein (DUF1810 family)
MNGLAILAILLVSTVPLYAQAQQPDTAKLKADAQKVVSTIRSNEAKTRAYCQLNILGDRLAEAAEEKNDQKAEALFQKVDDLENQLGPEYRTLFDALYEVDPDSKHLQDIMSMFNTLDESCPH